jgi:phosphotransferase system HPr (HPr) family protein
MFYADWKNQPPGHAMKTSNAEFSWREVVVVNELGLHARSAGLIAKAARNAAGRVCLQNRSECVDAKQIIDILTLGAARGDCLRVGIERDADRETLEYIAALFASGFGE